MRVKKNPTILVPLESYLFLQERQCIERLGKCHDKHRTERLTSNFEDHNYNGYMQIMNGDLGGCKGNPENAWEEQRWTSWSVEDVKKILNDTGLSWMPGEEVEYIEL